MPASTIFRFIHILLFLVSLNVFNAYSQSSVSLEKAQKYFEWGEYDSLSRICPSLLASLLSDYQASKLSQAQALGYCGVLAFEMGDSVTAHKRFESALMRDSSFKLDSRFVNSAALGLFEAGRSKMAILAPSTAAQNSLITSNLSNDSSELQSPELNTNASTVSEENSFSQEKHMNTPSKQKQNLILAGSFTLLSAGLLWLAWDAQQNHANLYSEWKYLARYGDSLEVFNAKGEQVHEANQKRIRWSGASAAGGLISAYLWWRFARIGAKPSTVQVGLGISPLASVYIRKSF